MGKKQTVRPTILELKLKRRIRSKARRGAGGGGWGGRSRGGVRGRASRNRARNSSRIRSSSSGKNCRRRCRENRAQFAGIPRLCPESQNPLALCTLGHPGAAFRGLHHSILTRRFALRWNPRALIAKSHPTLCPHCAGISGLCPESQTLVQFAGSPGLCPESQIRVHQGLSPTW